MSKGSKDKKMSITMSIKKILAKKKKGCSRWYQAQEPVLARKEHDEVNINNQDRGNL